MSLEGTGNRVQLSVVIPNYNDAHCLEELFSRLTGTLTASGIDRYEVIFIDDGSRDNSRDVIRKLCERDFRVKLIAFTRNFGHQFAITAGFDCSTGDAVLAMDADLQDPPELIGEFVKKWREGYDVVYGVRLQRQGESWFKRFTAAVFYRLLRSMTRTEIAVDSGDFRLLSRRALETLNKLRERSRFVRGMIGWLGYPQAPVYYERAKRWGGSSQYPLRKMIRLALDAIFSFSDLPLRVATWVGFAGIIPCLAYLLYSFIVKLVWGLPVPGWASLIAVVVFIGSVQLAVLGVMGQYVGRIYEELKGRPLYVVGERIGFSDADTRPFSGKP
jgi:glycosyltransferase involved in cell wall biosynthesis